jgi:hypothetical protein
MRGTRKQYDEPTREQVEALLKQFLDAPQRKSDGGFAEVPKGDKEELDAIVEALVKYRYEPDPDGDRPIKWDLCDWTRQEPSRFAMLPKDGTARRLDIAQMNVAIASDDLRSVVNEMRFEREETE